VAVRPQVCNEQAQVARARANLHDTLRAAGFNERQHVLSHRRQLFLFPSVPAFVKLPVCGIQAGRPFVDFGTWQAHGIGHSRQ